MRALKASLCSAACLIALSGCRDTMKGNETYPTVANLIEVEADQLKIMEVRDIDKDILIVVGESPTRKYEVELTDANLKQDFAINSLENEEKINAKCLWNSEEYLLLKKYLTVATASITDEAVIDSQLCNPSLQKYLTLTVIDSSITLNKERKPLDSPQKSTLSIRDRPFQIRSQFYNLILISQNKTTKRTKKMDKISYPNIYISFAGEKIGRGVFSGRSFSEGEEIEETPVFILSKEHPELPKEFQNRVFRWDLMTNTTSGPAIALGFGSLYNHSEQPNVIYLANNNDKTLKFRARRDIIKGEQLTIHYRQENNGEIPENHNWFEEENIEKLNI
ncbi:SET domain-containing protein-lysine N-methyltransferase [Microbulbifer sp. JMSA008]|uniref:SET domain-containing protein-lysine N-methyltransferase n=1 Tax=Microbulbifer sp. JMSA008 TaxID=3243373 RepID=UPI00403A3D12